MLVKEVTVGAAAEKINLGFEDHPIGAFRGRDRFREEIKDGLGLAYARRGIRERFRVVAQGIANDLPHPPAGIRVVTDIGNTIGTDVVTANRQDLVPDFCRNPGKDSVAYNIVELSKVAP